MKKYILISSIASILTISIIWGFFYWKSNTNSNNPEKKEEAKEIVVSKPNLYSSLEEAKAHPVLLSNDNKPVRVTPQNFLTNLNFFTPEKWTYKQNNKVGEISFNEANKVKVFKFQFTFNKDGNVDVLDGGANNSDLKDTLIGKEKLLSNISSRGAENKIQNINFGDEIYVYQLKDAQPGISIDKFISNDTKKNSYIWILAKKDVLVYVEAEFDDLSKEDYFEFYILPTFEIK